MLETLKNKTKQTTRKKDSIARVLCYSNVWKSYLILNVLKVLKAKVIIHAVCLYKCR